MLLHVVVLSSFLQAVGIAGEIRVYFLPFSRNCLMLFHADTTTALTFPELHNRDKNERKA